MIPLRRSELALGLLMGVAFLAALLIWGPIDEEEYQLGVFATQVHLQHLARGEWLYWLNDLGFGTPLPIGHRLDAHPVFALAAFTSLRVALSAMWLAQIAVASVFVLRLAAASGIRPPLRLVLLFAYLFSSASMNWFYATDWQTFVIGWTMYPVLVFYLREAVLSPELGRSSLAKADSRQPTAGFWLNTVRLAVLFALVILNSHPGYLGPLFLVLVIYTLAVAPLRARVYGCLVAALVLCVAMSAERLFFFASEMQRFPPGMMRDDIQPGYGARAYADAALAPFGAPVRAALAAGADPVAYYVETYRGQRDPFLGLPLTVAVLLAVARLFWKPARDGSAWRDPDARGHAVAFAAAVLLSLTNPEMLFRVPSGSWLFRDPAILFGIMAGGLVVQRGLAHASRAVRYGVWALIVLQIGQQLAAAGPAFYRVYALRDLLQFYAFQGRATGIGERLVHHAARFGPRIYLSREVQRRARSQLTPYGIHEITDLPFLGLNPVNAWFKSVSMDRLHPSRTLMHGYIEGQAGVIEDLTLLDALAINLVLVSEKSGPVPAGLTVLERFPIEVEGGGTDVLVLLGNPDAWPKAVLLAASAARLTLPVRPGCEHDGALCRSFDALVPTRLPDRVSVSETNGSYTLRVTPSPEERLLFMSVFQRPEWRARAGDRPLPVIEIGGAFIGVVVPAGVEAIGLDFVPVTRIVLTWSGSIALIASLMALGFLGSSVPKFRGS